MFQINMIPVARVQGIPRRRRSRRLNPGPDLQNEVHNVAHTVRMYAPVGITGFPKSGKKTLAHRLGNMQEGAFNEEVPFKYMYGSHIEGEFYPPEVNRRFLLLLKLYIIHPPNFPPFKPPLPSRNWNDFCCMIVVFDVTKPKTFAAVPLYVERLRDSAFLGENYFIVGNKSDLRYLQLRSKPEVRAEDALEMADRIRGSYFECSAKRNENVWPLLTAMKNSGAKKRYVIK